jgi:hypothetical protein
MRSSHGEGSETESSKPRKKKKIIYEPAQTPHVVMGINEIRRKLKLTILKEKRDLNQMVPEIERGHEIQLVTPGFVLLSLLSFIDVFDRETSTPDLLNKWMADPSRRPVILGAGDYMYIEISERDENTRKAVVIVVLPFKSKG